MLKDTRIDTKLILAALWTSLVFCYLYGDYFELYTPDKVTSLMTGNNNLDTPAKLFAASVVLASPSIMVPLSLIMTPRVNRLVNIALGVVFSVMTMVIAASSLTAWYSFYAFLAVDRDPDHPDHCRLPRLEVAAHHRDDAARPSTTAQGGTSPPGRQADLPPHGDGTRPVRSFG